MSFACYRREDEIGVITLNRPERLNAIGGALLADFSAALQAGFADEDAAVLVLTGAGRAFCAGDDLKEFDQQSASEAAIRAHIGAIQRITRLMLGCEKLILGAVHGYAVGGGFEWMLNCDLVVAADDLVAFFPEMDLGQFVTGGVTHLLPQALGYQRAMELLVLGERQDAARLERLNLVNRVVPRDELAVKAMELARSAAKKSRFSVGRLKALLNQELGRPLWHAVEQEEAITIETFSRPGAAKRVGRFAERKSRG
ncbi:MAG: enoyl-CoA hydratase/isomerase family protein [Acidisphaera sp.]|nr:enoyl-CoA hydratase/isomerase family protein [Acidisphaera sp.]